MIKYENVPIAGKVKKQKALIKLLNIGIDKETKKKRDNFMMDARKKYANDVFEDEQTLYVD